MELLDYVFLISSALYLPIMIPCFIKGPGKAFDELMPGVPPAVMGHQFMVHVLYIDMGKNCLVVLLGLYASLVSSHIPTKKAIAYLLAFQNAWAMFIAHGLASPQKMDQPYMALVTDPLVMTICGGPMAALSSLPC